MSMRLLPSQILIEGCLFESDGNDWQWFSCRQCVCFIAPTSLTQTFPFILTHSVSAFITTRLVMMEFATLLKG